MGAVLSLPLAGLGALIGLGVLHWERVYERKPLADARAQLAVGRNPRHARDDAATGRRCAVQGLQDDLAIPVVSSEGDDEGARAGLSPEGRPA